MSVVLRGLRRVVTLIVFLAVSRPIPQISASIPGVNVETDPFAVLIE